MLGRDAVRGDQGSPEQLRIPRLLPIPGQVLVQLGDLVSPDSIVARADLAPGCRWVIPAAKQLEISASCLATHLLVRPGERVMQSQLLAEVDDRARPRRECRAPQDGFLEEISWESGQLILREETCALPLPVVVSAADYLRCKPQQLPNYLWKTKGESVRRGEVLAMILPERILTSPISGQLTGFNLKTGEITIIPATDQMTLSAAVDGVVAEVVASWGCLVRCQAWVVGGKLQLGSEAYGHLQLVTSTEQGVISDRDITGEMAGRVIVVGAMFTEEAFWKANAIGVKAIISGGAHLGDLLPVWGEAPESGARSNMAVFLTEGFGCLPMCSETFRLLQSKEGYFASLINRPSGAPPQILIFPSR